jgi:hypothetical protein
MLIACLFRRVQCPHCARKFVSLAALGAHIRRRHAVGTGPALSFPKFG